MRYYYQKNINYHNNVRYGLVDAAVNALMMAYDKYLKDFRGLEYRIVFFNGQEVKFQINDEELANLLGINPDYLVSKEMSAIIKEVLGYNINENTSKHEILLMVLNGIDRITYNDSQNMRQSILDYPTVWSKSTAFLEIMNGLQMRKFWGVSSKEGHEIRFGQDGERVVFQPSNICLFFPIAEKEGCYNILKLKDNETVRGYRVEKMCFSKRFGEIIASQEPTTPRQIVIDAYDGGTCISLLKDWERIELEESINNAIASTKIPDQIADDYGSDQPEAVTEHGGCGHRY